jgi:hypothetical protein
VDIDAPKDGRPATRVNWLVRQLKSAPDSTRVEAFTVHARGAGAAELLGGVRANPALLIADPTKDLRAFRVAITTPAGTRAAAGAAGLSTRSSTPSTASTARCSSTSKRGPPPRRVCVNRPTPRPRPRPR